jgi:hypothetical protein
LRKIRSPHTIGVEPLHAGISCFHLMLSEVLHFSGRFFVSGAVPSPLGPRQPGHVPAAIVTETLHANSAHAVARESLGKTLME